MKQVVITLTNGKLILEVIDLKAKDQVFERNVFDWKKGELAEVAKNALRKVDNKEPIRILLTEDFYYLAGFEVEKKYENDREKIKELAEELIIEDLDRVRWDYAVVGEQEKIVLVQCFALTKIFNNELETVLKDSSVKFDVIEPYSLAIMRSFESNSPSFLLLHTDEMTSISMLVKNGLVVFSKYFKLSKIDEQVSELALFCEKFYKFKLSKLILSGVDKSRAEKISDSLALDIVEVEIPANLNLVEKTLIKGKDSKVLNLDEKSKVDVVDEEQAVDRDEPETGRESTVENDKSISILPLILVLISIIGIAIGFFLTKLF